MSLSTFFTNMELNTAQIISSTTFIVVDLILFLVLGAIFVLAFCIFRSVYLHNQIVADEEIEAQTNFPILHWVLSGANQPSTTFQSSRETPIVLTPRY